MRRRRRADSGASFLDRALAEIEQFTPSTGANLVGVDTFEPPGEKLYLIGWFRTRAAADAALVKRASLGTDERVYVYAASAPSAGLRRKGPRSGPRKGRENLGGR